jgi:hypothetical protein
MPGRVHGAGNQPGQRALRVGGLRFPGRVTGTAPLCSPAAMLPHNSPGLRLRRPSPHLRGRSLAESGRMTPPMVTSALSATLTRMRSPSGCSSGMSAGRAVASGEE